MPQFKEVAPYGTYGTLKSTIERFKESTVPTKLNRHVLHDVSGGAFSALISALRFFGLIDENQGVKDEFREVVEAARKGQTDYQDKMTQVVCDAYDPIVGAQFDLQAGTLPDLEKKFRDAGVPQGQMLTKAIRFYLKALEDAGVKVSEHITKKRPRSKKAKDPKAPKKPKSGGGGGGGGGGSTFETLPPNRDVVPQDFDRLPIPGISGAFIQYPTNLTEANCDLFDAMLLGLRTFAKSRAGTEGKKK